jgi:stress response protein SCP2
MTESPMPPATGDQGAAEQDVPRVVHQRGTFPSAGRGVVFSLNEGVAIKDKFVARMNWDVLRSPEDIVIHLAAFLVGKDSRVPVGNPYYSVHHDNDRSKDGSTERAGRRKHGSVLTLESLTVSLPLVNDDVVKIVLAAYIQDAKPLNHNFAKVSGAEVSFTMPSSDSASLDEEKDVVEPHLLDGDYKNHETAVVIGELIRREGSWTYRDIGQAYMDLVEVGALYGVVFITG